MADLQCLLGHGRRVVLPKLEHGLVALPLGAEPRARGGAVGRVLCLLERLHKDLVGIGLEFGDLLLGDAALSQKLLAIHLHDAGYVTYTLHTRYMTRPSARSFLQYTCVSYPKLKQTKRN